MSTDTSTAEATATTAPPTAPTNGVPDALGGQLREVLALRERPPRPSAVSASITFLWRALRRIRHVPEQLFDVTAWPIMMTLIFTYLFGGAISGDTGDYLQFLLPGLLVQSVLLITVYTGVTLNTDITKGMFDRFRSLPIWRPSALVGAMLGDAVRYSIASAVTIGLGLILGFRPEGGFVGVVLGVLLLLVFSFALTWPWTALAMVLRTPNSVMGMSMLGLFPLTFASSVFVDPATMPGWLQAAVNVNPITHLVDGVRGFMHGTADWSSVLVVLIASAVLLLIFAPLTMRLYRRKT